MTQALSATPLYSPLVGKDSLVHDSAWLEWFRRIDALVQASSLSGALLSVNNLSDVASVGASRHSLGLGTADSPSFAGLTLSGLTPSLLVVTDGNSKLTTITFAALAAALSIGGTGNATVSSLTIDNLTGILRASSGTVGTTLIGNSLSFATSTLNTIQDIQTSASPLFVGLTLSSLSASKVVVSNGSSALISGTNTDAEIASAVSLKHNRQHALDGTSDHTIGGLTSTYLIKSDGSKVVPATNTDTEVSAAVTASHARSHALDGTSDHTIGSLTSTYLVKSDGSKLVPATNVDSDVASAVSLKHAAVTVSAPIALATQALSLVTNAGSPAKVTAIDIGALANTDTVVPTSKAVTTAIAAVKGRFVGRTPASADFTMTSFTADGTWRTLSLAAIVPTGAFAVVLRLAISNTGAVNKGFFIRKNNNGGAGLSEIFFIQQVLSVTIGGPGISGCDTSQVIEYWLDTSVTWSAVTLTVTGWFI